MVVLAKGSVGGQTGDRCLVEPEPLCKIAKIAISAHF
jgi:hypothetical protein